MSHKKSYILAILMAIVSFTSCTDNDFMGAPSTGHEQGETPMSFSISMGEGNEATRAIEQGSTNGEDYDNTINLDDVRILVFQAEEGADKGKFVCEANLTIKNKESKIRYKFSGGVENVDHSKLYTFLALCNTQGTLKVNLDNIDFKNYTLDGLLNELQYSGYTSAFTENLIKGTSNARIPMWGVVTLYPEDAGIDITTTDVGADGKTLDNDENGKLLGFSPNNDNPFYKGCIEIPVQRALAKVHVKLSEATASYYSLTGVTLNRTNTSGYLTPNANQRYKSTTFSTAAAITTNSGVNVKGYYAESNRYTENSQDYPKYMATNNNSNNNMGVNIPSGVTAIESTEESPLSFYPTTANEYVILIPEYQNLKDATSKLAANLTTNYAKMSLTFSPLANGSATSDTSDDETHTLHFADYGEDEKTPGTYFDIVRNTLYDYTVSLESGGLEANVRVMPWQYETMEYELSQNAEVEIISAPSAEFNYTNGRYTNKTIYETDNYATFIIKVKEPKGVRWNAHLSNPYFFDFTVDTQDYGYGGDEVHIIKVKPTYPYNTTKELQTTDLFFTVETLRDREVQLTYAEADDVDDNDYGIAADTRLHITQVSASAEEVGDETTPFTVASGLYDYTRRDTDLGLSQPEGIVTIQISDGVSGKGFANGVVMTEFKGNLYSMWQRSAEVEDAADTYVEYASLSVTTENNNRANSKSIWPNSPSVLCNLNTINNSGNTDITNKGIEFCSSGGWISTENQLYAFINCWETAESTIDGGYACYRTSSDGTNWGTVTNVKMSGGGIMEGVIEQDPHVMENGRIITAAHFQQGDEGLYVSPIYTDDLTQGWTKAAFTHTTAYKESKSNDGVITRTESKQSKEMEPSLFKRNNGSLVMIFRDNEQNAEAQSTYKLMASVSYDYGETWTKSVLTNMPDSRSKQCAGNLPDGTAYIVNNPVNDRDRWPLVITLSKDGFTFDTAYLLRSGTMMDNGTAWNGTDNQYPDVQTKKRSDGSWRYRGYHYPKAMVHGDYLYVSYSTNKEDVEYTRIPLSSIQLNDPSAR